MIVYRLTQSRFKDDLSGEGASTYGGRWNSKGHRMLYCTEHVSLAVLELVVNFNKSESPFIPTFHLLEINLPETRYLTLQVADLKKDWRADVNYSRFIGDEFLKAKSALMMKVPSAVVPEENNVIINPFHKDFHKIEIVRAKIYKLDGRLTV